MKPAILLGVAIVAAGAIGFVASGSSEVPQSPSATTLPPASTSADLQVQAPGLGGSVKEVIDVPSYTYLLLDTEEGDTWAAVPTASVKVGDQVVITDTTRMTDFASSTLERTFDVIYFGTLSTGEGDQLPPGHPPTGAGTGVSANGHDLSKDGHPTSTTTGLDPALADKPVDKAAGSNARRISEVYDDQQALAGKTVRVRGLVVKSMPDILGKTFVHLQDGSGDPSTGSHDLTATTSAVPKPGDIVTLEGKLTLDVDIGVGYRYDVMLEDSSIVEE